MRAVWCHERNAHAFGSQRKVLGEHYTPEHAAQVTVTVSLLEVQWANDGPMMGQWWANDGPMMGQRWANDGTMMGRWANDRPMMGQ